MKIDWLGASGSEAKNCPADIDLKERSACALRDKTRVIGWMRGTGSSAKYEMHRYYRDTVATIYREK